MIQPGDLLSYVIRETTGQTAGGCGPCRECMDEMNRNGWLWCYRNRTNIARRLVESARQRGFHVSDDRALTLVMAGFRQFWKFRQSSGNKNMKTFTIRRITEVPDAISAKDALARATEGSVISVTVGEQRPVKFPITEIMAIEAETLTDAYARIDQAEVLSISAGSPRPNPNLPAPLAKVAPAPTA